MTRYFLGVDIGGTKSYTMIAAEDGRIVGEYLTGAGNYQSVGYDGFAHTLAQGVNAALAEAGLNTADISGAGFGVAGYDFDSDGDAMHPIIRALGMDAPYALVNDAVISLVGGAVEGWGVAVVAGTSCNCRGRDRAGREGRIVGNGAAFGEYAGSVELVAEAIRAVSRAWSRRGPATALEAALMARVGARDTLDLVEGLSKGYFQLGPQDAPLIFQTAAGGDAVARELIVWAGRELGGLACGVIRQLNLEDEAFDVVLSGSFYKGSPVLQQEIAQGVGAVAPEARLVHFEHPPVIGAVLLGMEQCGISGEARQRARVGLLKHQGA